MYRWVVGLVGFFPSPAQTQVKQDYLVQTPSSDPATKVTKGNVGRKAVRMFLCGYYATPQRKISTLTSLIVFIDDTCVTGGTVSVESSRCV